MLRAVLVCFCPVFLPFLTAVEDLLLWTDVAKSAGMLAAATVLY
jgi:hypothetical protein